MNRFSSTKFLLGSALLAANLFGHQADFLVSGQELQGDPSDTVGKNGLAETIECRMDTSGILKLQYNPFVDAYVEVDPVFSSGLSLALDDDYEFDDDFSRQYPVVEARICWCTQYFDRRLAFCPVQFDACKVEGDDGPITCFSHGYQGNMFVRGFWFICIFWFAALAYAFTCSENGSSARAFLRRKLFLRCSSSETEEEHLMTEVEDMIERAPEQATWLLRSAFMRERSRQVRQIRRQRIRRSTSWRHGGSNNYNGGANDEEAGHTGHETSNSLSLPQNSTAWQLAMELKVKTYDGDGTESEESLEDAKGCVEEKDDDSDKKGGQDDEPVPAFSFANASHLISSAIANITDNTHDNNHLDDNDAVKCAICLSPIQKGDRIGDIPCGHIFCVDCLKDWIKRKNHCPLCQRSGLATPRGVTQANDTLRSLSATEGSEQEGSASLSTDQEESSTQRQAQPDAAESGSALRIYIPNNSSGNERFRFYNLQL